jgi:ABC-type multidrug transport system fused ATPase/permease subunit
VETIYDDLAGSRAVMPGAPSQDRMDLRTSIELRGLCFAYPEAQKDTLSHVNLTIPARQATGIVGSTGAGKSTMVDLILGILEPTAGGIFIDGVQLTQGNMRAWQNAIGYVPQQIFLADDTVARNIAFGVPERDIDRGAVEAAAKMARIDGFVNDEMPQGYDTLIGERGIRLSGGQRQRIGIARALYHNPDVLILDEATSALDNDTEAEVMRAIDDLAGHKTVIMIAHRRNTLRACGSLVNVEDGGATITKQHDMPDATDRTAKGAQG